MATSPEGDERIRELEGAILAHKRACSDQANWCSNDRCQINEHDHELWSLVEVHQ